MTAALRHQLPSRARATDPAAAVIGAAIRQARLRKGLPQDAFGALVGLDKFTVSTIECGRLPLPEARRDDDAAVLDLDADDLRAPAHIASTADERAHLAAPRLLTPADRAAILELMRDAAPTGA